MPGERRGTEIWVWGSASSHPAEQTCSQAASFPTRQSHSDLITASTPLTRSLLFTKHKKRHCCQSPPGSPLALRVHRRAPRALFCPPPTSSSRTLAGSEQRFHQHMCVGARCPPGQVGAGAKTTGTACLCLGCWGTSCGHSPSCPVRRTPLLFLFTNKDTRDGRWRRSS